MYHVFSFHGKRIHVLLKCIIIITYYHLQQEWQLSVEQVAEYKEVFMLFDKDEDGVLSFPELTVVMKSLGQRPSGKYLKQNNFLTYVSRYVFYYYKKGEKKYCNNFFMIYYFQSCKMTSIL